MHKIIRRHTSLLTNHVSFAVLILIVVFGVRYYFNFDYGGYFWPWVLLISLGAAFLIAGTKFSVWYRDYLIISDKRIIHHHQKGIFNKIVIESLYSDIIEVSYNQKGFSSSIYGYGNIKIKINGGVIKFDNVKNPQEIVELINNQREKYFNG